MSSKSWVNAARRQGYADRMKSRTKYPNQHTIKEYRQAYLKGYADAKYKQSKQTRKFRIGFAILDNRRILFGSI